MRGFKSGVGRHYRLCLKTSLQSRMGGPARGNHRFCLSPENKYAEAACLEHDNDTVLHRVLDSWERKSCNYQGEENNATECLITTLSHGSVATVEQADLHVSQSEVKPFSHVRPLRPSEPHLGFILTFIHFLVPPPPQFYDDVFFFIIRCLLKHKTDNMIKYFSFVQQILFVTH